MKYLKNILIVSILFVAICNGQINQTSVGNELLQYVFGVEGKTNIERGEFIKNTLKQMNVSSVTAPFTKVIVHNKDTVKINGENIFVRMGSGTQRIVVGAHYDTYKDSPGANDNGSGVATLLGLIKYMQDVEWNYLVDFVFFDQEENGLIGSAQYIEKFVVPQKHVAMINIDIVGTGEELYVGPIGSNSTKIFKQINDAAQKTGFKMFATPHYPIADHYTFNAYNLQAISISVVPKGDSEKLIEFVKNGYQADTTNYPEVLKTMHSFEDRSRLVTEQSLSIAFEYSKELLLQINQSQFTEQEKIVPKQKTVKRRR